jgi:hypothetical protein
LIQVVSSGKPEDRCINILVFVIYGNFKI